MYHCGGLNAVENRKNLLPLARIETRFVGRPARRLIVIPTEISVTGKNFALGLGLAQV
jgi:hypothetical protein